MSALHGHHATTLQSLPFISDDECLVRLAAVVEHHNTGQMPDDDNLDELAGLIGRLAVPIEL